ncbi:hypothetical protein COBT_003731 [Conglomerata obtusa]
MEDTTGKKSAKKRKEFDTFIDVSNWDEDSIHQYLSSSEDSIEDVYRTLRSYVLHDLLTDDLKVYWYDDL